MDIFARREENDNAAAISGILSIMRCRLQEGCKDEPVMLAELILTLLMQGVSGLY